ncbi:serine protease inhibitor 88Ea-like isoform X2 [Drosophila obscura]|nr:serine protease inhibitor 88Ea-like isoform X2 [Drosophila obscura]XP_022208714.1 serine protease inhibitor 88Ea-like isoform X2 [Drosophila obscura]XP_022208721.1 serine protease inhibitor 88Ea-like isoform X2 [Drosophila obscura]
MQLLNLSLLLLLLPALISADLCSVKPNQTFLEKRLNLYRGQQNFAVSMLDVIRTSTPNDNVFFSPYSTYHALLLAYFGSTGETERQLSSVLHLEWADSKEMVRSAYSVEKRNRESRSKKSPLKFSSADRIYFDLETPLASCLETRFSDEIVKLDFKGKAEESRIAINDWIAAETDNQIKDMLAPGDIDARTQLALANAAYFKGQWVSKFQANNTAQKPFYTSSTNASFVPMMHQKGTFLHNVDEQLRAHVLQMPYRTTLDEAAEDEETKSDMSMVVVLPPFNSGSLEDVLSRLNAETLEESLNNAMPREIEVSIPKFEFEQRLELVPILAKMGISNIFEPTATFHDFTEQTVSFGDAKHVAKIKVDEEGSTAAAATVLVSYRSARPIEPTKFECNHPFVFLIWDHSSRAILFTGIYRDPKTIKQ